MNKIYMMIGVIMFIVGVMIMVFLLSYIPKTYRASVTALIEIGLIVDGIVFALYGWVQEKEVKK